MTKRKTDEWLFNEICMFNDTIENYEVILLKQFTFPVAHVVGTQ